MSDAMVEYDIEVAKLARERAERELRREKLLIEELELAVAQRKRDANLSPEWQANESERLGVMRRSIEIEERRLLLAERQTAALERIAAALEQR